MKTLKKLFLSYLCLILFAVTVGFAQAPVDIFNSFNGNLTSGDRGGTWTNTNWGYTTAGSLEPCNPYSNPGMAFFDAWDFGSGTTGDLISPSFVIDPSHSIKYVSFWLYRGTWYANADPLYIAINSTSSYSGATALGTYYHYYGSTPPEGSSGWKQYTINIPAGFTGTGYLIFHAYSNYGSNIYIDDLTIRSYAPKPDAQITQILRSGFTSATAFALGDYPVSVAFRNGGVVNLTACTVTIQTTTSDVNPQFQTMDWVGNLAPNASATVTFASPLTSFRTKAPTYGPIGVQANILASLNGGSYTDPNMADNSLLTNFSPFPYDIDINSPGYGIQPLGDGGSVPIIVRVLNRGGKPIDPTWVGPPANTGVTFDYGVDGIYQGSYVMTPGQSVLPGQFTDIQIGTGAFPPKTPMGPYFISCSASFSNAAVAGVESDLTNNSSTMTKAPKLLEGTTYTVGGPGAHFSTFSAAMGYLSGGGVVGTQGLPVTFLVNDQGTPFGEKFVVGNFYNPGNSMVNFVKDPGGSSASFLYNLLGIGDYLGEFNNASNLSFDGFDFTVNEFGGVWGGMFKIWNNSSNITFRNCNFNGVPKYDETNNYALFTIDQSSQLTWDNDNFSYGSIGILELTPASLCRSITVANNFFRGNDWKAMDFNYNAAFGDCPTGVNIHDNAITSYSSGLNTYYPNYGIIATNSTSIVNNTFTGVHGNTAGPADQSAIYLVHTPGLFTQPATITGNIVNNCQDINGIYLKEVSDALVQNNTLSITQSIVGLPYWIHGVWIDNTLAPAFTNAVNILDNTITLGSKNKAAGISALNTANNLYNYNQINMVNDPSFGGTTLRGIDMNTVNVSNVANNRVSGQDAVGMYVVNATSSFFVYNTVAISSATLSNDFAGGYFESGNPTVWRNIFNNKGVGKAIVVNGGVFDAGDNSYWTAASPDLGLNFGRFGLTDISVRYTLGVLDTHATMEDWRYYTNLVPPPHPSELNSRMNDREFVSTTDLRLAKFYDDMVYVSALFASVPNPADPPIPPTLSPVLFDWPWGYATLENFDAQTQQRAGGGFFAGSFGLHPVLSILSQPENIVDCFSAPNHDFRCAAFLTQGVPIRFQWYKDDVPMTAQTNVNYNKAVLAFAPLTYDMAGVYKCKVFGFGTDVLWSDPVTMNVLAPVKITRDPESKNADLGTAVMFEVEAHAVMDSLINDPPLFSPEYQWFKGDSVILPSNKHFSGQNTSILGIRTVAASDFRADYTVQVTAHCGKVTSAQFALSAYPGVNITGQPANVTKCEGEQAVLTVAANVTNGGTGLTYQWKKGGQSLPNGTGPTYTIAALAQADAGSYSCVITAIPGDKSVTTDNAIVTVNVKPTITSQPVGTVATKADSSFTISVDATGTEPIGYQWYKDNNKLDTKTGKTLTVDSVKTSDAGIYYCMVTNECDAIGTKSAKTTVTVTTKDVTGVTDAIAGGFVLSQNNPNPFNESTIVTFASPRETSVKLSVTDLFGRELSVLLDGVVSSGSHDVKINSNELKLSTGLYYITLTADGYTLTRKMILVK